MTVLCVKALAGEESSKLTPGQAGSVTAGVGGPACSPARDPHAREAGRGRQPG